MSVITITQKAVNRLSTEKISTITGMTDNEVLLKNVDLIPESVTPKTTVENALGVLFSYIPTEVIALYVAVISTIDSSNPKASWIAFFAFLVFTPVVVWLVYAAKVQNSTGVIPITFASLPLWEMFASTLAFVAWGFALPDSVFQSFTWYSQSVAGVSILLTSTILSLIAPFFNKS